ncbi:MAG: glycosyltransferase [bacterium]|nr:glycosyltransferase [bacterium]
MSHYDSPLVSIGMPTYNGARFIRQTLDYLLAQDYKNFELIVSDNASEDETQQIVLDYAKKDKRIKYYRNDVNLGMAENFKRVFELSSGKYFMWASDHDLHHPTFISRCVEILEKNPNVVLVYSKSIYIDHEGKELGPIYLNQMDTRGLPEVQRFLHVLWNTDFFAVYGLIRRQALERTKIIRKVWSPDYVLLLELSLIGEFMRIPDILFYPRKNRPDENEFNSKIMRVRALGIEEHFSDIYKITPQTLMGQTRNEIIKVILSSHKLNVVNKIFLVFQVLHYFKHSYNVSYYNPLGAYLKLLVPGKYKFKVRNYVNNILDIIVSYVIAKQRRTVRKDIVS